MRSLKTDYVFFKICFASSILSCKSRPENFRFHHLRHTFATRLVQTGDDIYTAQKLERWKTISMVMRYAHHHPESLRAGVEILDRVPARVSSTLAQSAPRATAESDAKLR